MACSLKKAEMLDAPRPHLWSEQVRIGDHREKDDDECTRTCSLGYLPQRANFKSAKSS